MVTVRVESCDAEFVMSTEAGFRFELPHVRFPPVGWEVTEQLRVTTPVKPPEGVTVIAEVLPAVAPWLIVMGGGEGLLTAKSCGRSTVTNRVVEEVMLPEVPVTVI